MSDKPEGRDVTDEFVQTMREMAAKRKTCAHANYRGWDEHGRSCPDCGIILNDPGD